MQIWQACGIKYLSDQGYDVDGLRIIDYGNCEYLAMVECWALRKPSIWAGLNKLRPAWPTYLDLWYVDKTTAHIIRLADIVEIIMGAARAEPWFAAIHTQEPVTGILPQLFELICSTGKLVQNLNARLFTGYLKHKRERVQQFHSLDNLEFSRRWSNTQSGKGLLLFGLLEASLQDA